MRQLKITKSITNRESASLDKYLQEIGREELVTVEEEVELAQRIRKGDQAALEKLTKANLRFVVSVAKQYQNQGLSLPDLINEGNLGLIKAAEKFDETRGFKFISYAVWWIRQSILQALAEQSRIVRLPLNQVGSLNKINKALSKFEQENERMPSPEELSEILDIPRDKIADTLRVSGRHVSVDAPFVDGEDNSLLDVLVNTDSPNADKGLVNESLNKEIERALKTGRLNEEQEGLIPLIQAARQHQYRREVLDTYQNRCAVTGCSESNALQVTRIVSYLGMASNRPSNGLCLRADIRQLFDRHLISIDPHNLTVHVSSNLMKSEYGDLEGRTILYPHTTKHRPSQQRLAAHFAEYRERTAVQAKRALERN